MSLKECLDERAGKITSFPDCQARRALFLIWNENDESADKCCRAAGDFGDGYMAEISVNDSADAVQKLEEAFKDCRKKIDALEITCDQGFYILTVGTVPISLAGFAPPDHCVMEYVRLLDAVSWDKPQIEEQNEYQTEWRIKKEDTGAVRAILYHAMYSEHLIEPKNYEMGGDRHVYGLKFMEYSAVKEVMVSHYLSLLKRQLTSSGYTEEEMKQHLNMDSQFKEVLNKCIHPLWLPITGYDKLVEILKKTCRWKLLKEKFSKKPEIETPLTIRQALCILNGEEDGKPKAEWIREKLVRTELPFLSKKIMKGRQQSLKESLIKKFSLYDIRYLLPGKMEAFSKECGTEKREEIIQGFEEEIEKILEEPFIVEGLEIDDILRGLSRYYESWKSYIKICTEEACWKASADLVNEMKTSVQNRYNELRTAKNVLQGSKIKSWEPSLPFDTSGIDIHSEKGLINDIETYIKYQEFESEHVLQMIWDTDNFYGGTAENHTDVRYHPQIHLIYHHELFDGEPERENLKFSWIMHPEKYLPKSLFWELRIYTYFGNNSECNNR